MNMNVSSL